MIPSDQVRADLDAAVYQRGLVIDSQPHLQRAYNMPSISKGIGD